MKNALYEAEVVGAAGHLTIRIRACNPEGPHARPRRIASFLYELAAELERKAEEERAGWVITPSPSQDSVRVALGPNDSYASVAIEGVLQAMGLAGDGP